MASSIPVARVRRVYGKNVWEVPQPFGPDGWRIIRKDRGGSVIFSVAEFDGHEWIHASTSRVDRMPDYDDLVLLHRAGFGDGWAVQVFAPADEHINIHQHALHLWGRLDGSRVHPNFGASGSI